MPAPDSPSLASRLAHFFKMTFVVGLLSILAFALIIPFERLLPDGTLGTVLSITLGLIFAGILGHFLVRLLSPADQFLEYPDLSGMPTPADLDQIERELQIELPQAYRELLLNYPIKSDLGNADRLLWHHGSRLLRQNLNLRDTLPTAGQPAWPKHYFFIGHEKPIGTLALDLSHSPAKVVCSESGRVQHFEVEAETFDEFLANYLDDLQNHGVDFELPYRLPAPWQRSLPGCLMIPIVFALILLLAALLGGGLGG